MAERDDLTLDPSLESWIESANDPGTDFPIQNLPFGACSILGPDSEAHVCVAIGDQALDLSGLWTAGLFAGTPVEESNVFDSGALNGFLSMGREAWTAVRRRLSELLRADTPTLRDDEALRGSVLTPLDRLDLLVPAQIGDYTDFYASIHHATNVGSMFRPDNPLMPNYKHLPVGYHGRASSIVVSGVPVRRPMGQLRASDDEPPVFEPCRLLDYELEFGFFVGPGNRLGARIPVRNAREQIFGMVIVNDWSARDVQKWEYQPLGPFNAKNFATSISPWVVTLDALEPFRIAQPKRGPEDPPLLPYLEPTEDFAYNIIGEVAIQTHQMRERGIEPHVVSRGSFKDMYWTMAQMLAHHSSTGCNMRPGDLLASGTVSGPEENARGCLLELTWRGQNPVKLPSGEERKFLQDGDTVVMTAHCESADARRIGFSECRCEILPAE